MTYIKAERYCSNVAAMWQLATELLSVCDNCLTGYVITMVNDVGLGRGIKFNFTLPFVT